MRIDNDTKLDYKDVLIRPKRSTLRSRLQVELRRSFTFRNYKPYAMSIESIKDKPSYDGIPIMASNMDGVGTFTMADKLAEGGIFTCLVKTYSADELIEYFDSDMPERTENVAMSIGTSDDDWCKLEIVYAIQVKVRVYGYRKWL